MAAKIDISTHLGLLSPVQTNAVLWGNTMPKIIVYCGDDVFQWEFDPLDNAKFNLGCLKLTDGMKEMVDGSLRESVRGYRLIADFHILNTGNRDLLRFLREMFNADQIIFTPHDGNMLNPKTQTYQFEMFVESDFEPNYIAGIMIGHEISFRLIGIELLSEIPEDTNIMNLIEASMMRVDGADVVNEQTSICYWGEKMYYGGWETAAEDFNLVCFWEYIPPEERDPYGDW